LAQNLVPIIQAIQNSKCKPQGEILHRPYPIELQKTFAEQAARQIGFDFEAGRLDVTAHPFCTGIGPGDCRITTRYNANFFNESFFGVLHEAGHGLYEQGLLAEQFGLPCGSACSLWIHESQSRFWENQVGRSHRYWQMLFPKAQAHFSPVLADVRLDDFYFAINEVKPSFIRVEADEATYNLHIILRFELELALLSGDLAVKDLPQVWRDRFTQLFGITPPDDKLGCLQDIHWSMGGIGYVPTYTLGNLYSAQLMNAAQQQIVNLNELILQGDFVPLREWLRENIHIHGKRYTADGLIEKAVGEPPQSRAFIDYLRSKYQPLYQF
jgi:carboxypeptidase Taq